MLATIKPSSLADWVAGKTEYTLAEWLPVYDQLWQEKVEPTASTIKASNSHLRRLAESGFSSRRLSEITTQMVASYLEEYKVSRGAPSAKQMRSKLSDIFRRAEAQGLIEAGRSPVAATDTPRITIVRERLSVEQFKAIREAAPVWLRNAMNLAVITGQRREDIVGMKFADWREGRLHVVQGKSGGRTRLALDGAIHLTALDMSIADVVKDCRDLVASPYPVHHVRHQGHAKPGQKVAANTVTNSFAETRAAAGLIAAEGRSPTTFHEIRSLSQRLYREEFGAEFAQAILGHRHAETTAKYNDLRGEWKVISAS